MIEFDESKFCHHPSFFLQPKNAPNDVRVENPNNTNTHDPHGKSISEETVKTKNEKPQIQHGDGPRKIRDPTLDRINL